MIRNLRKQLQMRLKISAALPVALLLPYSGAHFANDEVEHIEIYEVADPIARNQMRSGIFVSAKDRMTPLTVTRSCIGCESNGRHWN